MKETMRTVAGSTSAQMTIVEPQPTSFDAESNGQPFSAVRKPQSCTPMLNPLAHSR